MLLRLPETGALLFSIHTYMLRIGDLPEDLEIVTGPGCSICVMPAGHIDAFVKIGRQPDVITATCEDLLRVQGSKESLESIKANGALVEVVDSPMEALDLARSHPEKIVVFTAVGFEGAAPDVAETILEAHENLVELSPENLPKFKDVLTFIREDLKKKEAGGSAGE